MDIKIKSPIISALSQRFNEHNLTFNFGSTYHDSFGVGAYYSSFHVAHPGQEYDVVKLTDWFNSVLQGFDLPVSKPLTKHPGWLYFPQTSKTEVIYSERLINVRRMKASSRDPRFEISPLDRSNQLVLDAGKRGLVHSEVRDLTHNLWIVGYPERRILEMAIQGKLGARNFVAPSEIGQFHLG